MGENGNEVQTVLEGEEAKMVNERLEKLDAEIASYREAIRNAEDALDSAEKELNEVLAELPN